MDEFERLVFSKTYVTNNATIRVPWIRLTLDIILSPSTGLVTDAEASVPQLLLEIMNVEHLWHCNEQEAQQHRSNRGAHGGIGAGIAAGGTSGDHNRRIRYPRLFGFSLCKRSF